MAVILCFEMPFAKRHRGIIGSPVVLRTYCPSRDSDPEKYYYLKICMYFPWRSDQSVIEGDYNSLEESFMYRSSAITDNMSRLDAVAPETMESLIKQSKCCNSGGTHGSSSVKGNRMGDSAVLEKKSRNIAGLTPNLFVELNRSGRTKLSTNSSN